ncbi:TonB-dependent siderophore receptor [Rhodanobacter spathiphylli]|uniref:TonB-dependent siderophore receptor n=1 Tax=Rhodanobacter spathiphylli TaxID=347483 RepID=UPI0006818901|nr:TonB-dependent siderophore receptor [Rhodanobacter spathiphylli]
MSSIPSSSVASAAPRHRSALPHAIRMAWLATLVSFGVSTHAADIPAATSAGGDAQQNTATTLEGVQVTAPIAKDSNSVTKTDTPITEIPQSVSVITDEQMSLRGIQGIEEAVWYTAGAQGGGYGPDSRSDWLLVRGFTPARYMDGLAVAEGSGTGITRIEPYGLERLEVLKGPSSVVYGAMPPGGMVNMVSKRPTEQPLHEVGVEVGSFDLRQGTFDFGGPLNDSGTLLYRLTGLARNSDTMVDHIKDDRYYLAPALTWKPDNSTSLTVLSHFQKSATASGGGFLPAEGTLLPSPNGRIPRHRFTGEPGQNDYDKTLASIGYEFHHDFASGLAFNQNLRYGKADVDNNGGNVGAFGLLGDGRTLLRYLFPNENHTKTFGVDNNLQYTFDAGSVQHIVLAGVDYRRAKDDYASAFDFNVGGLDVFDPVYGSPVTVPAYTSHTLQTQTQLGVYLQDQIRLGRWGITLGGRQDHVKTDTDNLIGGTTTGQTDDAFSGRVGVNYLFDSGLAPYVSWSHSFQPTVGTDFAGKAFSPTTGDQYEAGLKYQPAGGNGLLSASVYQITQQNSLTIDPNHTLYQVQQGETRLRGVELEGRWNIGRNLSVYGDYTYSDSEVTRSNDLPSLGRQIALLPKQQASLGADYTIVGGTLAGLGFGGGVRYVGEHYGDIYNDWKTPSYTLLDAAVHYDTGGWRLQLNVSNLTDKTYVSACNSAAWCYYGYERTVTASARYRW